MSCSCFDCDANVESSTSDDRMDVTRGDDRMDDSGRVNAKHSVDEREVARMAPMQKNCMMGLNVREDRWRVDCDVGI